MKKRIVAATMATALALSIPMTAHANWIQDTNGIWSWVVDGIKSTGWELIDGKWYYFDIVGNMQTGWVEDGDTWYYMDNSGSMQTGWVEESDTWYYMDNSGAMQVGWVEESDTWYFMDESGAMQDGIIEIEGSVYYFDESGAMATGTVEIDGAIIEIDESGALKDVTDVVVDKTFEQVPTISSTSASVTESSSSTITTDPGSSNVVYEEEPHYCSYELVPNNDGTHNRVCYECGSSSKRDCTYEATSDAHVKKCTGCGHEVTSQCDSEEIVYLDETYHITSCSVCGENEKEVEHAYKTTDDKHVKECVGCGYELTSECNSKDVEYVDETYHVTSCSICGGNVKEVEHSCLDDKNGWTYVEDGTHSKKCNGCKVDVIVDCNYEIAEFVDEEYHKATCTLCGETVVVKHSFDENENAQCLCGYMKGYVLASSANALKQVVSTGATEIYLTDGEYDVEGCKGKTLSIAGSKKAVIKLRNEGELGMDYDFDGATVTFNGLTIDTTQNGGTYPGFARMEATFNDCTIKGTFNLSSRKKIFNNCIFEVTGDSYNIWTWGVEDVTFNNCIFNCDGKSILVYNQSCDVYVNNCTFNDNGSISGKAAIEACNGDNGPNCVTLNIKVTETTVNGFDENNSTSTLWGNKNSLDTDHLNVYVDGEEVY